MTDETKDDQTKDRIERTMVFTKLERDIIRFALRSMGAKDGPQIVVQTAQALYIEFDSSLK